MPIATHLIQLGANELAQGDGVDSGALSWRGWVPIFILLAGCSSMCEPEKKRQRVEEIWETVPGHKNFRVSSKGRIANKKTGRQATTKIGRRSGKLTVTLNGIHLKVCALVASCFSITPEKDDQTILHHTDRDVSNNDVTNLQWVSPRELAAIFSLRKDEIWVPIPNYEHQYLISSKGCVMNMMTGHFVSQRKSTAQFSLQRGKGQTSLMVYRTMVSAFKIIPQTKDETNIHHIDFNVKNNCVENLRWISDAELVSINMRRLEGIKGIPGEKWEPVAGYSNYYVSSAGRICNALFKRMLEQSVNKAGYKVVSLSQGRDDEAKYTTRTSKSIYAHRIVACAFFGKPLENQTVDHINQHRSDNRTVNLRWASRSEQSRNRENPKKHICLKLISTCLTSGEQTVFRTAGEAASFLKLSLGLDLKNSTIRKYISRCIVGNSPYMDRIFEYDILLPTGDIRESPSYPGTMISSCGMFKNPGGYWRFGHENAFGYLLAKINDVQVLVHRLVLEAIRESCPSLEQTHVNHINGEKKNNCVNNLAYTTPKENAQHAMETNLNPSRKSVVGTHILSGVTKTYVSMVSAERETKCAHQSISKCCKGKQKTCKGYTWRFA